MKKFLWLGIPALVLATSCADNLDYDADPKSATKVPGETLLTNAELNLTRTVVSTSVNLNPFRLWVQQWAETTYPDESRFDFITRQINNAFWNSLYRDVLRDLNEAKRLVSADATLQEAQKNNQLATIEVLEVYTWTILVDNFGDIPYTESMDFNKSQPAYDDDKAIYANLIVRLDGAIGQFSDGAGFGSGDLIYGGDGASWKKFANSLKLKMALTISDDDATKAKMMIEQASPMAFESSADNASITFDATPPNTNPLWDDLVQSGRTDFIATSYFVGKLTNGTAEVGDDDPRLDEYFYRSRPDLLSFKGGVAGDANGFSFSLPRMEYASQPGGDYNYASYVQADGSVDVDAELAGRNAEREALKTLPGVLMTYTEVEFLRAEAVERGATITGSAEEHYNNAVTASIVDEWGNSEDEANAYLALDRVKYTSSGSGADYKAKIGNQKWIALVNQPVENWKEYRRLDNPKLVKPAAAISEIPSRYTYPIPETNLNTTNYNNASSAIGGDAIGSKVFWDKF